jgi:hypothetical protein
MTFNEGMQINTSATTTSGGGRRRVIIGGGIGGLIIVAVGLFLGIDWGPALKMTMTASLWVRMNCRSWCAC